MADGIPKRLVWAALLAGLAMHGCRAAMIDHNARQLIVPAALPGQMTLGLTGSGQDLVDEGAIDLYRRVTAGDGADRDVWVIRANPSPTGADAPTRGTVVLLHPLMTGRSWFLGLAKELAGRQYDAVAAASRLRVPLRIAHGRLDRIVPYEHSEAIYQAAGGPKEFVEQPIHGHALELYRDEWMADPIEALQEVLPGDKTPTGREPGPMDQ